jgi:hypothetical protein
MPTRQTIRGGRKSGVSPASSANGSTRIVRSVPPLSTTQVIALLIPLVLIQLGLIVAALYDLEKEERRVRGGSKLVWVLIIVFVNLLGPIVYFAVGREDV